MSNSLSNSNLGQDYQGSGLEPQRSSTYYDVLEISQDSSRIQIREAYIRLKNTYSKNNQALYSLLSPEEAQSSLEALEEAYRVLYDEQLRKDYDLSLQEKKDRGSGVHDPFNDSTEVEEKNHQVGVDTQVESRDLWGEKPSALVKADTAKKMRFSGAALCTETQESISNIIETTEVFDGAFLKALRDSQGVSLHELQDRTKVSLQYIIAMENNDFQTLPSVVYVKGFLKILLQYLGVKNGVDQVVVKYLECLKHWQTSKGIEQF